MSDARLEELLAEYLHAEECGTPLDEDALVRQHPDFAEELASFFANRRAMRQLADELHVQHLPTTGIDGSPPPLPGNGPQGRDFGDYELEQEIARGGMGIVFRARQRSLQRPVALKMILAGRAASSIDLARFRQEAEAAARLAHPHIVPVYEVGEHEGWSYYTMKLVEGGNLHQQLSALRADPQAAARLVEKVARAVHFAHQHGILHRDLKPANVLIDEQGEPHVTDFGLARILDSHDRMTRTGAALGTPGYMAPEQIRGERLLTVAVDVYGLGAILFVCLTGRPPFQGANAWEAIQRALDSEAPSPRTSNPLVDRELETICRKALERDPARRYESAAALADDLARWLAHEPILAQPPGAVRRLLKWTRRHPAWTAVLAASALLLILGLIQFRVTWSALAGQREANQRAEALLYRTLLGLAQRESSAGAPLFARQALGQCPESRRGWEWVYARRLCFVTPANAFGPLAEPPSGGGISGDGRRVYAVDAAGHAIVWEADGRSRLSLALPADDGVPQAALTPDGNRLILATHRRIRAIAVDSGEEIWSHDVPGTPVKLAFSPDGTLLGLLSSGQPPPLHSDHFTLLNDRGERIASFPVTQARDPLEEWFTFAPDNRLLLYPQPDPNHVFAGPPEPLRVHDALTGERLPDVPIPRRPLTSPYAMPRAISADGKLLVHYYGFPHSQVEIRRVADGSVKRVQTDPGTPFGFTFSNDGRMLAFVLQELNADFDEFRLQDSAPPMVSPAGAKLRRQAWVLTVHVVETQTGRELSVIRGVPGNMLQLAFSPDGRQLLGFGGAYKASDRGIDESFGFVWNWEVPARETARVLHASDQAVQDLLITSDGRRMVTGGDDKLIRIWDADSGALIHELSGHAHPIRNLAGGRDPKTVLSVGGNEVFEWNTESGTSRPVFAGEAETSPGEMHGVALHPGGQLAAFAQSHAGSHVDLFDLATHQRRFQVDGPPQFPTFSPDGKLLAIPYQFDLHGELKIIDVATGQLVHHWKSPSQGLALSLGWGYLRAAFSPDGRYVAVVGNIGGADLYDLKAGHFVRRFTGHATTVWDVEFTADGSRLATSGYADRTVKLWSLASGEEVLTLRGHEGSVTGLAFSPDSTRLVTADTQGAVRIWEAK